MKAFANVSRLLLLFLLGTTLVLAGCEGDDGDPGPPGPAGPQGPPGGDIIPNPQLAEVVVYYVDTKGTSTTSDDSWKTHYELGLGATSPAGLPDTSGAFVKKFSAQIVQEGSFALKLVNLVNPDEATYPLLITYGGEGNYKQRFVVTLPLSASKHISPLQFNDRYDLRSEPTGGLDKKWVNYHAERWYNPGTNQLTVPANQHAFDGNCAGCHFTGYTLLRNAGGQEAADAGNLTVNYNSGTAPGPRSYVGSTQCLSCHGAQENWGQTFHKLVLRKPLEFTRPQEKGADLFAETINRGILLSLGVIDEPDTPPAFSASMLHVAPDPNGTVDFDRDGNLDEINIGCEACHGPGSVHITSQSPLDIINPEELTVAEANMICGQCHIRGLSFETFTDFFAEASATSPARAPFPAINGPNGGGVFTFPEGRGDVLSDYYVWDAGSPLATGSGLTPGAFDSQYWGGEPSGGNFVASKQHHQQWIDMINGPHGDGAGTDIFCFDCHELHDNRAPQGKQIVTQREDAASGVVIPTANENDTLCLSCHFALPPFNDAAFGPLTAQDIANVSLNFQFNSEMANYKRAVISHTQHYFDPTNLDDSGGDFQGASNCTECHMPLTAKTALNYDIRAHTFKTIMPELSNSASPSAGVPNSCSASCHAGTTDAEFTALQAAWDAKFPETGGVIDPTARTNNIVDEWLQSGHANFSGEPFNHWNEDGEVPASCAKCHSKNGFRDFAADGAVDAPARLGTVISCGTCHTFGDKPQKFVDPSTLFDTRTAGDPIDQVVFPANEFAPAGQEATFAVRSLDDDSNICMACHQGRESGLTVANAIATNPGGPHSFINRHYFAAAAILFGTEVKAGFEYSGRTYRGRNTFASHPAPFTTCRACHLRDTEMNHTFEPDITFCDNCHADAGTAFPGPLTSFENLGLPFGAANVDYDGDGTGESFQGEIDGFAGDGVSKPAGTLLTAIQNYASTNITPIVYGPGSYPYWFKDTDADGIADPGEITFSNRFTTFDDTLLKAAYNFHSGQDPCGDIHNYKFVIQTLYDSLDDLDNGLQDNSVTGTRP